MVKAFMVRINLNSSTVKVRVGQRQKSPEIQRRASNDEIGGPAPTSASSINQVAAADNSMNVMTQTHDLRNS